MIVTPKTKDQTETKKTTLSKLQSAVNQRKETATVPVTRLSKSNQVKLFIYGDLGTGKTFQIIGALLCGEKVLVVSTDFGSNGLSTVIKHLPKIGREDLLENLFHIDLQNYEQVVKFFKDPEFFLASDQSDLPEDWVPDLTVWDGFSSFNNDYLDEYLRKDDLLIEGDDRWNYFYGVKRGTVHGLRLFMAQIIRGKKQHKMLLALKGDVSREEQKKQHMREEVTPLIAGGAKKLVSGPFDVVLQTFKLDGKFWYRCEGDSDKFLLRSRGFDFPPKMEADPEKLWRILTGKGE